MALICPGIYSFGQLYIKGKIKGQQQHLPLYNFLADKGFFELGPALGYGPYTGKTSNEELNFPTINQQAAQCDAIAKILWENKQLPIISQEKKELKI
jgi:hypothetical protein